MVLERWLQRTREIQAIPAPTFDENLRAEYLAQAFRSLDSLFPEIDEVGNLYLRIPGGLGDPVIVSAHLDHVFPAGTVLTTTARNGRLYGPGVGDNAVALAALVELAEDLSAMDLPSDVWLVANVGEEGLGNLRGMREIVTRFGDSPGAYIAVEGMALGHIYHRALPVRRLRVEVHTRGGHSWIHAGRTSAVHLLIDLGAKLQALPLPASPRTTLNIGSFSGGTSVNTIADHAYLDLDLRSEDPASLAALGESIAALVRQQKVADTEIEVQEIGARPGGELPADHPLVQAACAAFKHGDAAPLRFDAASTDASLPISLGLPAICVGLTRGGEAHSMDEFIELDPMGGGYRSLLALVQAGTVLGGSGSS